jgi:hypothetical protein
MTEPQLPNSNLNVASNEQTTSNTPPHSSASESQTSTTFSVQQALEQFKADGKRLLIHYSILVIKFLSENFFNAERYKPFFSPEFSVANYTQQLLRMNKHLDQTFLKHAINQLETLIKLQVK